MSEEQYGTYQHFYGNPIAKPPCRMINAMMYGFFIKGTYVSIQSYIDNTLNSISNSEFHFKALSSYCLLTFTDIENIASKVEPFRSYGWMQETDIIVWLPVAQIDSATNKMTHLYWYPAFITVNNINALVNGRETWGYNKYQCRYEMPDSHKKADYFSLSMETFNPFSPDTKMAWHELLNITRHSDDDSWFEELFEIGHEVADLLHSSCDEINISADLLKQFLSGFTHPQMDQILFKQFPDGFAENAVYKAVVHSPSEIKRIHKMGFLKDEFKVTINRLDAFPLNDMFGINIGEQMAKLPYYVSMDFDQDGAYEIVSGA
ncbi:MULTISPECIES: acetoacetate decarboxylase [Pseudoalteromonas]|uniref:Acetoacetate decarboxylase n=1 Tax=Pseudoalteromonas amylolytica TaxID=1859457 RepID=A0A1S1MRV0_9GAMM|nr:MULTISPECIES: acetoacetate decarboxylase [Pseudoalteromonas]MCF6434098.1 acetoacetate decarboxylase [Pseudoalteromonas sp. MMG022]OHU87995.1 acetoacetate decarboxylase [Pseudoalteromonas sp. JW3]OHU91435.1 acetoacetate decarboxylase [Pseudoalteromonas amylolytica]